MATRTTKILGVSLPPRLYKEVERTARASQKTKSELFREAWDAYKIYLEEQEFTQTSRVVREAARRRGYTIRSEEDIDRILHES